MLFTNKLYKRGKKQRINKKLDCLHTGVDRILYLLGKLVEKIVIL